MSILFTPHLEKTLVPTENLIYCSTLQLAWNELSNFMKGKITLGDDVQTKTVVDSLNAMGFKKEYLDESCYLASADLVGNGMVEKITRELKERFNEKSKFDFSGLNPNDIMAYAFLLKILPFEQKFDEIKTLEFNGTPVKAFGIKVRTDSPRKLLNQIRILHYENEDEFTISLKTKSDFIILAKLKPQATLKETLDAVKIGSPYYIQNKENLEIPKISFDKTQGFAELCGKIISVNGFATTYCIAQALQAIKFELDEEGAKLRSEAIFVAKRCCASFEQKPRNFIFDKPFLMCLKQKMSDQPYFVAWVGDTEILKPR
jgi:hypothetical protein